MRQIEDKGDKAIDAAQMTFNELADYYERIYLHEARYINERKISGLRALERAQIAVRLFRQHFGTRKLRGITYGDIYAYKQMRLAQPTQYKRPRTIAAMNRELVVLRRILNIGMREGYLIKSPFNSGDSLISAADENKRERILTREEESRLFAAIDSEPKREHLKGILLIALDCALRRGEIFTLKWSDVDLERRTITVRAFNAKTAKARTVGMTIRVYEDLVRRWLSSSLNKDALVFGVKVTVRTAFAKACKAADVRDFHLHDCRHTAITRLILAGLPPVEVMRLSGHSTLSCLYRYSNLDSDTVFRAAAALDAFNAKAAEAQATTAPELIN
ncbi:MAG: site-specific integrase [Pyrinomonadaceae bacterium]